MKNTQPLTKLESERVLQVLRNYHFTLGKINLQKNLIANNNNVFIVDAKGKKYVLRESQPQKSFQHLKLETAVLRYLKKRKFRFTPYTIVNKKGQDITIYKGRFYTLQNFMPGETCASWNNLTRFNEKKLANFFITSAKFTRAIAGFRTKLKIKNKPVYQYVKNGRKPFSSMLRKMPASKVKTFLNSNKHFVYEFVRENKKELDRVKYNGLPKQIVHFDLHPGNVNFSGDKVSGIFDFDWVRFDSRISDLAGTIGQSCYRYRGINGGIYNKKRIKIGLAAYRKAYGKSEFDLECENRLMKVALKGYMFFQLLWTMEWYLHNLKDPKAMEFMGHSLKVLKLNDYDWLFS